MVPAAMPRARPGLAHAGRRCRPGTALAGWRRRPGLAPAGRRRVEPVIERSPIVVGPMTVTVTPVTMAPPALRGLVMRIARRRLARHSLVMGHLLVDLLPRGIMLAVFLCRLSTGVLFEVLSPLNELLLVLEVLSGRVGCVVWHSRTTTSGLPAPNPAQKSMRTKSYAPFAALLTRRAESPSIGRTKSCADLIEAFIT